MAPTPAETDASNSSSRSRYVVLFHEMPADNDRDSHWDLMLEVNDQLETWSLNQLPCPDRTVNASRLPPHRMDYLNYEGPVSDNRGSVKKILSGTFSGEISMLMAGNKASIALMGNSPLLALFRPIKNDQWSIEFRAVLRD